MSPYVYMGVQFEEGQRTLVGQTDDQIILVFWMVSPRPIV